MRAILTDFCSDSNTIIMKENNNTFKEILEKLETIELLVSGKKEADFDDYISEHDAKELLNRGTTWFWNLRNEGFPYTKLGGQVYYHKKDLIMYFEDNTVNEW